MQPVLIKIYNNIYFKTFVDFDFLTLKIDQINKKRKQHNNFLFYLKNQNNIEHNIQNKNKIYQRILNIPQTSFAIIPYTPIEVYNINYIENYVNTT